MIRAAIYARYSSDKQTEQSIEGQLRVCEQYCKTNGIDIVDTYIDRALSASKNTDKRTDFLRMIKDSDKKLWDIVVVYKLDRFSRDRYDSAIYKAKLKKNGKTQRVSYWSQSWRVWLNFTQKNCRRKLLVVCTNQP